MSTTSGFCQNRERPRVHVIALGGTIAGVNVIGQASGDYQPGALSIDDLLDAVPGLRQSSEITAEQLANQPSFALTHDVWLQLAARVREACAQDDCAGVVVTHGTDTLEETAYFLHLTAVGEKPVVVTGSMRPATAVSADGPRNLQHAIAVAACAQARARGVLVVLNERIGSARDTRKSHTTSVDAFRAAFGGDLGRMVDDKPTFFRRPEREYGGLTLPAGQDLPRVAILFGHSHGEPTLVDAAVAAGTRGIVHAGMGNGGISPPVREALRNAVQRGVVVVSASHVGAGPLTLRAVDRTDGFVVDCGGLGPLKARILLMLALAQQVNATTLQNMFDRY